MKMKNKKFINYYKGQAILSAVVFLALLSLIIVFGSSSSALKETKMTRDFVVSQKSYFLAESGVEDLAYRVMTARHYDTNETLTLNGNSTVTSISGLGGEKQIVSSSNIYNLVRRTEIDLVNGSSIAFHYGVQAGQGGFDLQNSSFIDGNVYSNGPIQGANSNLITGDVVSAGAGGSVGGVHTNGSVYGHTISNSTIGGDAHYVNISGSTVSGILYPNSPDMSFGNMPISDDQISQWETDVSASVINSPCPYTISSANKTLGSVTINCDLIIKNSSTLTLTGPIWIKGNLTVNNSSIIKIDPSLGANSVAIIVDNPGNHLTGSEVDFSNSVQFLGTGVSGSYILVISQNSSAENGGNEDAISIGNSVTGNLLLYASHGNIDIQNSVSLKEVTAYEISLKNSAQVIYETGLANLIFSSGPSGGYSIDIWQEVP